MSSHEKRVNVELASDIFDESIETTETLPANICVVCSFTPVSRVVPEMFGKYRALCGGFSIS